MHTFLPQFPGAIFTPQQQQLATNQQSSNKNPFCAVDIAVKNDDDDVQSMAPSALSSEDDMRELEAWIATEPIPLEAMLVCEITEDMKELEDWASTDDATKEEKENSEEGTKEVENEQV